jgi:hypothetical protein
MSSKGTQFIRVFHLSFRNRSKGFKCPLCGISQTESTTDDSGEKSVRPMMAMESVKSNDYSICLLFQIRRYIINTEMAAGVIPSIREACPKEAGLMAVSFSFNSLERP